jgi:hypothetical protein
MMKQFFIKFDVPPFYDKRLNVEAKGRKAIRRKKDIQDDDVHFQEQYMPDLVNMNLRVANATDIEMDAATKEIDTILDHEAYRDKSNTIL